MKVLEGHNPCFSRILFAIIKNNIDNIELSSHNPCFSRILFAIYELEDKPSFKMKSQSLF